MKRVPIILLFALMVFKGRSQVDFEAFYGISGCFLKTDARCSGSLLNLNSSWSDNWIRFVEEGSIEHGRIGFTGEGGYGNLIIKNSNTGFGDLIILRGGNGGQFWMYPDGKLYANNIGDIGSHRDMHWNQTTGEIGWTSSSARFKTNIRPMHDDWMKILQVNPVTYTRQDDPDRWEVGYLAEDLDSIGLKSIVGYSAEGLPEYIDYEKMVLYLVEMVKIQQIAITRQESVISELQESVAYHSKNKEGCRKFSKKHVR